MNLVNTDGMVLIGPGSEWFWTAASGLVLAVTFVGIWRQLRAQRAANVVTRIEALWAHWTTDETEHAKLATALILRHGTDVPLLELFATAAPVLDFLDDVAELRSDGVVSLREIWRENSLEIQNWIAVLRPLVERMRATYGFGHFQQLDTLAAQLLEEDRRHSAHGLMPAQEWLDAVIAMSTTRLVQRRDAREGVIPGV